MKAQPNPAALTNFYRAAPPYMRLRKNSTSLQRRRTKRLSPRSILNPERRITHAAITENKRLSAVLEHIKAKQDKAPPKVKVKPVSAKNGYKKKGQDHTGRSSKMEPYYARKRAERELRAASQGSDI